MYKISQKNLLEEGFWKQFASTARQVGETGKAIGNVVAPEIADPIKKGYDWLKTTKKNVKRAGMTSSEIVKEQIIESGFHPHQDRNGVESKIKWGKKNTDGTITGSLKVGELGYNDDGEPKMAAEFQNILKSDVIFRYDPDTRDIKIVRAPYRQSRVQLPSTNPTPPTP
jgi:hypothetical protein